MMMMTVGSFMAQGQLRAKSANEKLFYQNKVIENAKHLAINICEMT